MLVKVCGLRARAEVEIAVEAGANAVGFVFCEKSSRNVSPDEARAASDGLPGNVKRVAVMQHPGKDEWETVLREFNPAVLQTDATDFAYLDVADNVERWPVYREGDEVPTDAGTSRQDQALFVYEGLKSGSGQTVDWTVAAAIARRRCMILAGGLDEHNVGMAIRTVHPAGVDVSSGVEKTPGKKDPGLIKRFIEAARVAGSHI